MISGTDTSWMKVVGCKGIVQREEGKALLISIEKNAGKKGPELWPLDG